MVDGLTSLASRFSPDETMTRLVAAIEKRGMTVAARIDHAAAAVKVGQTLRPTEVFIFGNPRAGTRLMQVAQNIGIDLPLRVLVWQDAAGDTWLGYNDPAWLARRHGAESGTDAVLSAMAAALLAVSRDAAGADEP